ncbi:hypothetical protein A1Q2_05806 [Trichosporon asahii var. asahii CBS 8904]|uniref:Uncharacterized protein n=2 Tax=Trichosporon asahii var. asahii TaxID=189963 RepID=K1VKS5_TRIAC|nr:hypothetical protein A1Q1_05649 [Trichosporon asahii var. asahii CBS 2479]EJT45886.1 hypothetical protein A1Q1_05649 [Trichosporon asahii var. asahii CBS 2479]EKC99841.1 hypothetical protein A1Q2_05806 [Trichosporon asahii var. asahii CBS 8904]
MAHQRLPELLESAVRFPAGVRRFPRREWRGVFGAPPFEPGSFMLKAQWAGREASRRWQTAIKKGSLDGMTTVDYAVAVFDLASHMNDFFRSLHLAAGTKIEKTSDWIALTDDMIELAFLRSRWFLRTRFPSAPILEELDMAFVRSFARPALNAQWRLLVDSGGHAPEPFEYDEARFTDVYLPTSRRPVPFTVVQLESPGAEPEVRWLIPGPSGGWIEVEDSSSSEYVTPPEGELPSDVSPQSTTSRSGAVNTSSDTSSAWSSDPQTSPERATDVPSTPCTPARRALRTITSIGSPSPRRE